MIARALRLVLLVLLVVGVWGAPVWADTGVPEVEVYDVAQEDRDRDGAPDRTTITCAIQTPNDRVLVYDQAGNMRRSAAWQEATDFADDTWVFDIGGQGGHTQATLIIAFSTEGPDTVARIYAAPGGVVHYRLSGREVVVLEPAHPTLTVRSRGGWLHAQGGLNYNLRWTADGLSFPSDLAQRYPLAFALDGEPDVEGAVGDEDGDGVPEYAWYTLLAAVPESEGIPRSSAQVNSGLQRPESLSGVVFWPLLNRPPDPDSRNYFTTPLTLAVDWATGAIEAFGFRGYPVEEGFHVNSLSPMRRGEVNTLQFENPMAYYDLAGDRDGLPELFIRLANTPEGTLYFIPTGPTRTSYQMVQYSWNQANHDALLWDYKLDLAGSNPFTDTITLGDLVLETVPHDALPRWALQHPWGLATFVAVEGGAGYLSSEGLYEWSTLEGIGASSTTMASVPGAEGVQREYLTGISSRSPEALYQELPEGFRGEYGEPGDVAWLYWSPVDARLHLLGARSGIYNGADGVRLEYRNLDGDAYLDAWRTSVGETTVAQLFQAGDHLIYGDRERVILREAALPREVFRAQPPADRDTWLALDALLASHRREWAADDLLAMIAAQPGPTTTVTGAALSAYRILEDGGFRFVLDLRAGYAAEGLHPDLTGLTPGQYVVTYRGGYTVEPLTPAQPVLAPLPQGLLLEEAVASRTNVLGWQLSNVGGADLLDAPLRVTATGPAGRTVVAERAVSVLAGESLLLTVPWRPPMAGEWTVRVSVGRVEESLTATHEATVFVAEPAQPSLERAWSAFGLVSPALPLVLLLVVLAAYGAAVAYLTGARHIAREDHDG